eukprot:2197321-Lingulodinium_polyedra.AAC.1
MTSWSQLAWCRLQRLECMSYQGIDFIKYALLAAVGTAAGVLPRLLEKKELKSASINHQHCHHQHQLSEYWID